MNSRTNRPTDLGRIIAGVGLLVGMLDISDAFIFYGLHGVPAVRVLQDIASGILAFTVAAIYLFTSRTLPLSRHPLSPALSMAWWFKASSTTSSFLYLTYLTSSQSRIFSPIPFVNGVAALVFCVGIPVALITRHYIPQQFP